MSTQPETQSPCVAMFYLENTTPFDALRWISFNWPLSNRWIAPRFVTGEWILTEDRLTIDLTESDLFGPAHGAVLWFNPHAIEFVAISAGNNRAQIRANCNCLALLKEFTDCLLNMQRIWGDSMGLDKWAVGIMDVSREDAVEMEYHNSMTEYFQSQILPPHVAALLTSEREDDDRKAPQIKFTIKAPKEDKAGKTPQIEPQREENPPQLFDPNETPPEAVNRKNGPGATTLTEREPSENQVRQMVKYVDSRESTDIHERTVRRWIKTWANPAMKQFDVIVQTLLNSEDNSVVLIVKRNCSSIEESVLKEWVKSWPRTIEEHKGRKKYK